MYLLYDMSLNWENWHRLRFLCSVMAFANKIAPDEYRLVGSYFVRDQGSGRLSSALGSVNLNADIVEVGVGVPITVLMVLVKESKEDGLPSVV